MTHRGSGLESGRVSLAHRWGGGGRGADGEWEGLTETKGGG